VSPFPSLSLSHTPSLFHNEIMKNEALNKIICSMLKNFKTALMFSVYNEYKGVRFFLYVNMSTNKNSLCKHKNISRKPALGDVS
jgi:hypothetical protein